MRAHSNRPPPPPVLPYWHRFLHPIWVTEHLDWPSLKIIFRDWCATFAMVVVEIVPYSRKWFGSTVYLLPIMTFVSPSGQLSVPTAIMVNIIMMMYIVCSWICGNILPQHISNHYFYGGLKKDDFAQILIDKGVCVAGPALEACLTNACEHGYFMKGNASVVYAFWFAVICSINFFLKFRDPAFYGNGAITGMIATVVCAQTSMQIPWVDIKETGALITKPMGLAFATNLLVACIIFPFTAGFQYTTYVIKAFKGVQSILQFQKDFMNGVKPSSENWLTYNGHEGLVGRTRMLVPVIKIVSESLPLEVSYTRFPLKLYPSFFITFSRLTSTCAGITTIYDSFEQARVSVGGYQGGEQKDGPNGKSYPIGNYEDTKSMSSILADRPLTLEQLDAAFEDINMTCSPMLEVMIQTLSVCCEWIETANHFRFYTILPFMRSKHVTRQREMAEKLAAAREVYEQAVSRFLAIHSHHDEKSTPFLAMQKALYAEYINELIRAMTLLVDQLSELDQNKATPRLTTGLSWKHLQIHRLAGLLAMSPGKAAVGNEAMTENEMRAPKSRDPDHGAPQHLLHRIGGKVRSAYHFIVQPRFMTPIKASIITIIPLLPCLIKQSHWWFYSHRIYWTVVMTNMSMAELSADNLFNAFNRVLHTFYAVVIGMVAWYISTGNGRGNYYGFGAVMGVIGFFAICYREFIPPGRSYFPRIMLIVAMNLVLGLSWFDGQEPSSVDIGVGFTAAWHRYVCVVAGIGIGTIGSNFPKPKSGKKMIRKILSAVVGETASIFCEVSEFSAIRMKNPDLVVDATKDPVAGHVTGTVLQLMGAKRLYGVVKFEPNLSGPWPVKAYNELLCLCFEVVELTLHLYTFIKRVKDVHLWLPRVVLVAGWRNHNLMAHYFSVVYMVSGALVQGKGLPQISTADLFYEHAKVVSREVHCMAMESKEDSSQEKRASDSSNSAHPEDVINTLLPQTEDASVFLAAVSVANKLYDRMDRILVTTKEVVGEQYWGHEYYLEELMRRDVV